MEVIFGGDGLADDDDEFEEDGGGADRVIDIKKISSGAVDKLVDKLAIGAHPSITLDERVRPLSVLPALRLMLTVPAERQLLLASSRTPELVGSLIALVARRASVEPDDSGAMCSADLEALVTLAPSLLPPPPQLRECAQNGPIKLWPL